MTSTLSPSDTGELRLAPYTIDQHVSRNLADTHVIRYTPGTWTPRTDPQSPDLHCPSGEYVALTELLPAADARPDPDAEPVFLAEVMPQPAVVVPRRGRRRGRGRAPGIPAWLTIALSFVAGATAGASVLAVAVLQAVTR